jgi:prolyl oligopeptidase PreP (S9A serine peptidase family)
VKENPGYVGWLADNNLEPRLGYRSTPTGGLEVLKLDEEGESLLMEIAPDDALTTYAIGFDATNTNLYALSSGGRDTAALVEIDFETGAEKVLAEGARADISAVAIDAKTHEIFGYATNYLRVDWHGLDDKSAAQMKAMQAAIPGDLQILASTADGNTLVVYADSAEKPGIYYLYDRAEDEARELFETRPVLDSDDLEPMYPVEIASRDGKTLVSYLTLPTGVARNDKGIPESPQPMVLYVHGGPWARDSYGYSATHQWLANRGYAVLSVNYRGSTGFGKGFVNAAIKEFSGKMHDDLIDAVNWAVENKIAEKDEIAIMGGSYGGYATLVGVTFTPDTFACGVDIVGPSSLVTLVESFPAYWGPSLEFTWYKYVGNPADETARADMFNRSPISRVKDIKVPLLIAQGENDPRVTKLESDQIVAAMNKNELPVTYLNYPDEGHGFARPENNMSFYATSEGFLSNCLGGRYEPIGDDFKGSSVQVLNGAEHVPGLSEITAETEVE